LPADHQVRFRGRSASISCETVRRHGEVVIDATRLGIQIDQHRRPQMPIGGDRSVDGVPRQKMTIFVTAILDATVCFAFHVVGHVDF
jgi:hypothetical protein